MAAYQLLVTQILFSVDGKKQPISNSVTTLEFNSEDEVELALLKISNDKDCNDGNIITYATRLY